MFLWKLSKKSRSYLARDVNTINLRCKEKVRKISLSINIAHHLGMALAGLTGEFIKADIHKFCMAHQTLVDLLIGKYPENVLHELFVEFKIISLENMKGKIEKVFKGLLELQKRRKNIVVADLNLIFITDSATLN